MSHSCWSCSKTFGTRDQLRSHFMNKVHRFLDVVCPWCLPTRQFRRALDLRIHAQEDHRSLVKKFGKKFPYDREGFYVAVEPRAYRLCLKGKPSEGEPVTYLKEAIIHNPGFQKPSEWQRGWDRHGPLSTVDYSIEGAVPYSPTRPEVWTPTYVDVGTTVSVVVVTGGPSGKTYRFLIYNQDERIRQKLERMKGAIRDPTAAVPQNWTSCSIRKGSTLSIIKAIGLAGVEVVKAEESGWEAEEEMPPSKKPRAATPSFPTFPPISPIKTPKDLPTISLLGDDSEDSIHTSKPASPPCRVVSLTKLRSKQSTSVTETPPPPVSALVSLSPMNTPTQVPDPTGGATPSSQPDLSSSSSLNTVPSPVQKHLLETTIAPATVSSTVTSSKVVPSEVVSSMDSYSSVSRKMKQPAQVSAAETPAPTTDAPEDTTLASTAKMLLMIGGMPLFPPGRRDWENSSIQLPIEGPMQFWPPHGWKEMNPDTRLLIWETTATILAMKWDMPLDRPYILDAFQLLALPNSKESDNTLAESRARHGNYTVLKRIALQKLIIGAETFIDMFTAAVDKSDSAKQGGYRDLVMTCATVPLRI